MGAAGGSRVGCVGRLWKAGRGRGRAGRAVPEEERAVHLVRLVVVALLDAGAQLALHALHAAAVPAAAFRGFLLRRHNRRRHRRGGGGGGEGKGGRMRTHARSSVATPLPGFRPLRRRPARDKRCGCAERRQRAGRGCLWAGAGGGWRRRGRGHREGDLLRDRLPSNACFSGIIIVFFFSCQNLPAPVLPTRNAAVIATPSA